MQSLGFGYGEIQTLRRIEMTLRRWFELECGNGNDYNSFMIERDETTGKPFMVIHPNDGGKYRTTQIADKEKGALKRLRALMATKPALWFYVQGDPRGCALYVGEQTDVIGQELGQVYNRGIAICY